MKRLLASTTPLALAVAFTCAACSDVDDHLAAGRVVDACERARQEYDAHGDASEEVQTFRAWMHANTRVKARLVPHDEVRGALGGAVGGYGDAAGIGVFELTSEVPGGFASIEPPDVALRPLELVTRMPPLVKLMRAARPYSLVWRALSENSQSLFNA